MGTVKVIELTLNTQGKARVWLQKMPDYSYPVAQMLAVQFPSAASEETGRLCACVEIFLHRGGHCPYGLLGAHFDPTRSKNITVQVGISTENGQVREKTLAGSIDQVREGLPAEYSESVLRGAASVKSLSHFGDGTLSFDCAAHGEVDSSAYIFHLLAAVVVEFLSLNPITTRTEYIEARMQEAIQRF